MLQAANVAKPAAAERPLTAAALGRSLSALLGHQQPDHLAVACSGGSDSLALALLAAEWGRARGIMVTALIVDHRLRRESGAEARQVAAWLRQRQVAAHILPWTGRKPKANRQAAARDARYRLLQRWCRAHEVRHLLLAHHMEDQAETVLLRAIRGSGVEGMSAMVPRRTLAGGVQLLRPLLDVGRDRLRAALRLRGQGWIEDPSNRDPSYARVRVRQALADLGGGGEVIRHLARTAANMARAGAALESVTDTLLAACAALQAAGYAWLLAEPLVAAPEEIRLRALARLLGQIGGEALPPRLDALQRLAAALTRPGFTGASLHRCRLVPLQGRILVCREARYLPPPLRLTAPLPALWDGRFRLSQAAAMPSGLQLAPLGNDNFPGLPDTGIPRPAWPGLPCILRRGRAVALPGTGLGVLVEGLALHFPA